MKGQQEFIKMKKRERTEGKKATVRRVPGGCRDLPTTLQVPEIRSIGRNTVQSSPDLAKGKDLHMKEPNRMNTNATSHAIELLDTTVRETQLDRMTHYDPAILYLVGDSSFEEATVDMHKRRKETKVDRGDPVPDPWNLDPIPCRNVLQE